MALSTAYDQGGEGASTWDWPVRRLDRKHLDVVTDSPAVANTVIQLVGELRLPTP